MTLNRLLPILNDILNISLIIPAYNEEQSIAQVLNDLPKNIFKQIIVVDNASTDRTADIAFERGASVISEPRRGYGQACLTGIKHLNPSTDIVVFADGDYSDHVDEVRKILDPIIHHGYDFVIGSRALGQREVGAMTPQALYGNMLACFLIRLFWSKNFTDLGPFRAITYASLKKLNMQDKDFGWTIEMQVKAVQHHLKIKEIPVDYRCRKGRSKISGTIKGTLLAGEKILRTIFFLKLKEIRQRRPIKPERTG